MSSAPWHAALLAALGGAAILGLTLAPPTPWAPAEHQPLTLAAKEVSLMRMKGTVA